MPAIIESALFAGILMVLLGTKGVSIPVIIGCLFIMYACYFTALYLIHIKRKEFISKVFWRDSDEDI